MRGHAYLAYTLIFCGGICLAQHTSTTIPNVIITAPKLTPSSLTNGSKTIIDKDQIATAGNTTLAQVLQNLGGVQLLDTTGNGTQVALSMRGFGANASSNTLLLINGIPLTNPDMAPPDLQAIPISEIESIEIIAGSESVLYGDQAVGGVININTREHANEKIGLSCGAGSYNQRNCMATLYHRYSQADVNAAIAVNHTDNYRKHSRFDQQVLLGGVRQDTSRGYYKFNFNITNENMQYPGALTYAQVGQNRRQASNDTDYFKNLHDFFHLRQLYNLNSAWIALTDIAYRQMNGDGVLYSSFTQSRSSFYIKPQLTGKYDRIKIQTGMDSQIDGYGLNSSFGSTKDHLQKYGIFAIANMTLTPRTTLAIGARGAQQNNQLSTMTTMDNINRAVATTLGLSYQATSHSSFYLRRAGSFRFPKAEENASNPSNTGLRTQRGIAYESGAEISQEKYSGKMGIYVLHLRDEIDFDPQQTPQQPFGTNTNLAPTVRHGGTLSGKYLLNNNMSVNGQYNFVNARFQSGVNKGNRIPLVSASIIRAGLDWCIKQNWHVYTDAIFTGSQFAASDNANITKIVGGYTTYNVNLRYNYLLFTAALHLNNVFNKYYYLYSVYQPGMATMDELFYPAPGRNATLILNYAFA